MSFFKKKKKGVGSINEELRGDLPLNATDVDSSNEQLTNELNQSPNPAHLNGGDVSFEQLKKNKKRQPKKAKKQKKGLFSMFAKKTNSENLPVSQAPTLNSSPVIEDRFNSDMNTPASSELGSSGLSTNSTDTSAPLSSLKTETDKPTSSKSTKQLKVIAGVLVFIIVGALVAFLMLPLLEGIGGKVTTEETKQETKQVATQSQANPPEPANPASASSATATDANGTVTVQPSESEVANKAEQTVTPPAQQAVQQEATTKQAPEQQTADGSETNNNTQSSDKANDSAKTAEAQQTAQVEPVKKPTPDGQIELTKESSNKSGEKLLGMGSDSKNKAPEKTLSNKDFIDLAGTKLYREE